ncbi:helix-turn-helix domain-containing protein [Halalkalibacter alkalisediminis]|uniref:Helix-turn-helix domain-containing protein n=2 Tax=Halalkalibacter alkalisediminis TaxID=935616 RepID=A0ABV6NFA8_9BACI
MIKYYRLKKHLTQSQLAEGICSVPHLSKIENNHYRASEATAFLLLEKLGIDLSQEYEKYQLLKTDLDEFVEAILYYDLESIHKYGKKLKEREELYAQTDLIHLYHIYMMRYYSFTKNLGKAKEHRKVLEKLQANLSPLEELLFSFNIGLLLFDENKMVEARDHFLTLKSMSISSFIIRDLFYQISLCFSVLNHPEKAVTYAKKALTYYKEENNFIRTVHTQMILGINYARLGLYNEGVDIYKILLRNTRLLRLDNLYHQIIYNYSLLLLRKNHFTEALHYLNEAITVFNKGSQHHILSLLAIIEILIKLKKDPSEIREHIKEVLQYSHSTNLKKYALLAQKFEYELTSHNEMYDFIENQLFPFLKKHHHIEEMMITALDLAKHHQTLGHIEKANDYYNEYISNLQKEEFQ